MPRQSLRGTTGPPQGELKPANGHYPVRGDEEEQARATQKSGGGSAGGQSLEEPPPPPPPRPNPPTPEDLFVERE